MNVKPIVVAALFIAVALTTGCGLQSELAQVTGVVTIDNKPYPGGKVIFTPVGDGQSDLAGRPSFGVPDANGRFRLSCYRQDDGALIGRHTVTLFRATDHDEIRPDLKDLAFRRVNLRGGFITISPGENQVDVILTSDEIRKYGNTL